MKKNKRIKITLVWVDEKEQWYMYNTDTINDNDLSYFLHEGYVAYDYVMDGNGIIVQNGYESGRVGEEWLYSLNLHCGALYLI